MKLLGETQQQEEIQMKRLNDIYQSSEIFMLEDTPAHQPAQGPT